MVSTILLGSPVVRKITRYEPGGTISIALPPAVAGEVASGGPALNFARLGDHSATEAPTGILSSKSVTLTWSIDAAVGAAGSMCEPRQAKFAGFMVVASSVSDCTNTAGCPLTTLAGAPQPQ